MKMIKFTNGSQLTSKIVHNSRLMVILAIIIVGVATILISRAASPNSSIEPENGTKSDAITTVSNSLASGGGYVRFGSTSSSECGKRVQNYTYQVPWGNAVWNQPVCNLARHPKSADYAERFYKWGPLNDGSPDSAYRYGRLKLGVDKDSNDRSGFSQPVYYAENATTEKRIYSGTYSSNLDGASGLTNEQKHFPDTKIPWNPAWKSSSGGDNQMIILDRSNGRIYELFGIQDACLFSGRICTGHVEVGRDEISGEIIDYRTYEGPLKRRGVGLSLFAGLITSEEVVAGEIRHALSVAVPNTAHAPECSSAQLGTNAEGTSCSTAWAPATKFEYSSEDRTNHPTLSEPFASVYTQDKLIPEGMRFALDISDADIDAWVNSQERFDGRSKLAETAKIFARALRDYGFQIHDTNGDTPAIQSPGTLNPLEKARWVELGFTEDHDGRDLLNGLIKQQDLYVVSPPTVTCEDGSLYKYYCMWSTAKY